MLLYIYFLNNPRLALWTNYNEKMRRYLKPNANESIVYQNVWAAPWLVWLSGLSTGLRTGRQQVRFLVRARAWGVWEAADPCFSHTCLSLSFSLPPISLKINKRNP